MAAEQDKLSYNITDDERQADPSGFTKFGAITTLDNLANGNVLLWDEIKALPYEVVYTKLLLNKTKTEYSERLRDIKTSKSKPKK